MLSISDILVVGWLMQGNISYGRLMGARTTWCQIMKIYLHHLPPFPVIVVRLSKFLSIYRKGSHCKVEIYTPIFYQRDRSRGHDVLGYSGTKQNLYSILYILTGVNRATLGVAWEGILALNIMSHRMGRPRCLLAGLSSYYKSLWDYDETIRTKRETKVLLQF